MAKARPLTKDGNTKIVDSLVPWPSWRRSFTPETGWPWKGTIRSRLSFSPIASARWTDGKVNRLHMVQSVIALPSHCEIFDRGIAAKVDFSFSGPQSVQVARLVNESKMKLGEIHTYLELFARYFLDLTPQVALVAGTCGQRR